MIKYEVVDGDVKTNSKDTENTVHLYMIITGNRNINMTMYRFNFKIPMYTCI